MEKRLLSDVLKYDGSLDDDVFCLTSRGSYPPNEDFPSSRGKGSFWCCLEDEVFSVFADKLRFPYQQFCLGGYLFLTIPKLFREKFLVFCKKHDQKFIEVDLCSHY